ncbi:ABC transporter permease [Telmatobacter bradus]|uniref:ABC transporter permease n=1 Tax=Telmatobacter bradus TaxID=474953 RepID=UPI003B43B8C2
MNQTDQRSRSSFEQTLHSASQTMGLSEVLKIAIDSFKASKARFALTALGMVIGTASVILVVTIGLTGRQYAMEQLQKIETNAVEVEYSGAGPMASARVHNSDSLTREDEKAVDAQLPGIIYSSPITDMHDRINFGGGVTKDTLILGVSDQYQYIRNLVVLSGRFLEKYDDDTHMKCAVVSELFAKERYGSDDAAVGQTFEISGIPFTIVGVFKLAVDDFGQTEIADQTILIPYSVVRYFTGSERVNQIYFSMRNMNEVPAASEEIVRIIQTRHRSNSVYKAQTMSSELTIANNILWGITAMLVAVATVTLAVGGVGIMNIMLATVRSRIREIGIRKALGATYKEIRMQFLTEAILISLAGGLVGTMLGLIVPLFIRLFTDYQLPISIWSVLVALASAMAVGVIFGTIPATRAAQMDPVDALKYE